MNLVGKDEDRIPFLQGIVLPIHRHVHLSRKERDDLKALVEMGREAEILPLFNFQIIGGAQMIELIKHEIPR